MITQFNKDYLHNELFKEHNAKTFKKQYQTLSICSKNEFKNDLNFTTSSEKILEFIRNDGIKIILITYQSLFLLVDIIIENDIEIDLICFDEAHHILGDGVKKMLFEENYDEEDVLDNDNLIDYNLNDNELNNNLNDNNLNDNNLNDNLNDNDEQFDDDYEEGNFLHRFVKKTLFFTATPKNSNGIKMHETVLGCATNDGYLTIENDDDSVCYDLPDCGKLIYEYKHTDGVRDNILNDFNVRVDLYASLKNNDNVLDKQDLINNLILDNNNILNNNHDKVKIYEAIFRAVLETNNTKVLTFHSRSETKSNSTSDVISFTNITDKELIAIYNRVFLEFPTKQKHSKIHLKNITASTKNKPKILELFENLPNNEICILASCKTIGEGVDTKNANMVVFVDSKNSYTEIIQNIGRVCRKNDNTKQFATILLPTMVSVNKYKDCKNDVDRDTVIRNEMSNSGDFNGILNVISALRQEDPYLFEMCLRYPNVYCEKEINDNIVKHGLVIDNKVLSKNNLFSDNNLIYNEDVSESDNFNGLSKKIGYNIQIINDKVDETDIVINNGFVNFRHYVKVNDGYKMVNGNYKDIIKKVNRNIKPNIHVSGEISVLWNFENDISIDKAIFGGYIKAIVKLENKKTWIEKLELVKNYIKENDKRPSSNDNDKDIKSLGNWVHYQIYIYKKQYEIMKNIKIRELWKNFIEEHLKYFDTAINIWKNKLEKVKKYIDENNKLPSSYSKNKQSNALNSWFKKQIFRYKNKIYMMKIIEIYDIFTQFMKNYEYLFIDNNTKWKISFEKIKIYINENNKLPASNDKNIEIKILFKWLKTQKRNYKTQTSIMKEKEIYDMFTQFMKEYEYLFIDGNTKWKNILLEVKKYIDANGKIPSIGSKIEDIKILGSWFSNQKMIYSKQIEIMKEPEIYNIFTNFLEEYDYVLTGQDKKWIQILNKLIEYIDKNNKLPSEFDNDAEIKTLGKWLSYHKTNYKRQIKLMKNKNIYDMFTQFFKDYEHLFIDNKTIWKNNLEKVKKYINENNDLPTNKTNNDEIKTLHNWIATQKKNYKEKTQIMKEQEMQILWEEFMQMYLTNKPIETQPNNLQPIELPINNSQIFKKPTKKKTTITLQSFTEINETNEINEIRHHQRLSNYQEISKKLTIQNSNTSYTMFQQNPTLWNDYHNARDFSFQGYDNQHEIPINKIITYIAKKILKKLTILDLGCGRNLIQEYFKNYPNLNIIGYDHISFNGSIQCDISKLPNDNETVDICIFSQSLMGSNWQSYLEEAMRVLRHNGEIIISESIERYETIKKYVNDKGLVIKFDDYIENNRWFYLHILNDTK